MNVSSYASSKMQAPLIFADMRANSVYVSATIAKNEYCYAPVLPSMNGVAGLAATMFWRLLGPSLAAFNDSRSSMVTIFPLHVLFAYL